MDSHRKISSVKRNPTETLCWILAIMALVAAVYIMSPWALIAGPGGPSAIFTTAASTGGLIGFSSVSALSGFMLIYGLVKKKMKWIRAGLLVNLFFRLYGFIIVLLVYGLTTTFIPAVTLIAIVVALYVSTYEKKR